MMTTIFHSRPGSVLPCFVLLILLCCGCGTSSKQDEAEGTVTGDPVYGGMAVVALAGDPDVLNPLIRRSSQAGQVLAEILDTLTELDEDLENIPRIARNWELAADGLSIRYQLNPWNWEDGQPLTAHDVALSFQLIKDPRVACPSRGFFRDVDSVEALNDSTLVYHFNRVLPDPLTRSNHAILPLHILESLDPQAVDSWALNQNPVSSGPFRFVEWESSRQIILERNPLYPDLSPRLDRVTFRIIREPAARVLALESGEVDFVMGVSSDEAKRLEKREDVRIHVTEGRRFYYLQWNCRNPRLTDALTRRALSLSLDRPRMMSSLLGGYGDFATSPVARVLWNHNDNLEGDPFDPPLARALLLEAGWKDNNGDGILERDGLDLELSILTRQGDPVRRDGVVILRENLEAIGCRVEVQTMELAAGLELLRAGQFDSYFGAMTPNLFGDPSSAVHSRAVDEYNQGFYSNAMVDSLLEAAVGQTDRRVALPLWYEAQAILQQDPPAAYLFSPNRLDAISSRLKDVRPHVLSPINNLAEWWIAESDRKYRTGGS